MSNGFTLLTANFPTVSGINSYSKITIEQNSYLVQAQECQIVNKEQALLILDGYIYNFNIDCLYQAIQSGNKEIFSDLDGCFCGIFINSEGIFAFNDRLGSKTIYWQKQQNSLCFSSRINLMPILDTKLSAKGAYESIHFRWLSGSQTLLESINKLPVKHFAYFSESTLLSSEKYWQLPKPQQVSRAPFAKKLEQTKNALTSYLQTINKKHKTAAIFLSGGVDSSLLAALSKDVFEKCYLITPVFPNDNNPELETAKQFARHLALEHILVEIKQETIRGNLQKLLSLSQEPLRNYSALTFIELMKHVPKDADIVLYGEAADILFGANNVHQTKKDLFRAKICRLTPQWLIKLAAKLNSKQGKIANIYRNLSNIDIILKSSKIKYDNSASSLVDSINTELTLPIENWDWFSDAQIASPNITYLKQIQLIDAPLAKHFLETQLIAEIYNKKLAVPFMTNDIFNITQSLKYKEYFSNVAKPILRELACQYFPRELIYQKKHGFPVPFISWLQGPLKDLVAEVSNEQELFDGKQLNNCSIKNHYELYWLLINWQLINKGIQQKQASQEATA